VTAKSPLLELSAQLVESHAMLMETQYVVDSNGKKTGVLLSLRQYEKLLADLHDLAVVAERRDEKPISLDEMKRRLKKDALIQSPP
jgi:hypothetical protein